MFSTIQRPSRSLTWITLSLLPPPISTNGRSSAPMWTAAGAPAWTLGSVTVMASPWETCDWNDVTAYVPWLQLEDPLGVGAEELGPHLILERHVAHLGHDPLEREAHREVAAVDDLVGAAGVGVVDEV